MNQGCGKTKSFGHGEVVICGDIYYGGNKYMCETCKINSLKSEIERLNFATNPAPQACT
jgi:hypothetical protein